LNKMAASTRRFPPPRTNPDVFTVGALEALPGVRHAFLSRRGGVSMGAFSTLNCGFGSGDDRERVAENRGRALRAAGLARDRIVTCFQIHSAEVAVAEQPWSLDQRPKVDGLVTRRANLALGILTADCAPVLFADREARVVGAAHAGWRGALGGILEATVEAMEKLGAERKRIAAGIGPAIAQASYEVGPEFPAPFLAQNQDNERFFKPAPKDGHFLFDLPGYSAKRLARLGLGAIQILARDTCAEEELFFSYRRAGQRGESNYGRLLSLIYLEP